jgi:hypothetical protein
MTAFRTFGVNRATSAGRRCQDPRMSVVEDAVAERLEGGRPGRLRAVLAAVAIGATAAVLAYRLLRTRQEESS